MTATTPSPECTGLYECPCGNREQFTGVDHHGSVGDDHDCGGGNCGDGLCECCLGLCDCEDVLTQDFDVWPYTPEERDAALRLLVLGEEVPSTMLPCPDYDRHDGGSGADIGSYNAIYCRRCGAVVWQNEPTP
jgi:hypothetical protein